MSCILVLRIFITISKKIFVLCTEQDPSKKIQAYVM